MNDVTKSTNKSSNVNSGSSLLPSSADTIKRKFTATFIEQKKKRSLCYKPSKTVKDKKSKKPMRKDKNGIEITSKNRTKVKVTFIDMVSSFPIEKILYITILYNANTKIFINYSSIS